jgi:hypothetical protein
MNKLSVVEEKVRVVACLVEGNSLRATVRMTGVHRTTVQKLLVESPASKTQRLWVWQLFCVRNLLVYAGFAR